MGSLLRVVRSGIIPTAIHSELTDLGYGRTFTPVKKQLITKLLLASVSAVLLSASGLLTATARGDFHTIPDSSLPTGLTSDPYNQITNQVNTNNGYAATFTRIGNPGNAPDTTGYGSVDYTYQISTYEISNGLLFYAREYGFNDREAIIGGRYGYIFSPVTVFNWRQAASYVNWLNTREGFHPAYKINNSNGDYYFQVSLDLWTPADAGYDANNLYRNKLAKYVLPSENEWYKAAYGKSDGSGYYLYPTASDSPPQPIYNGDPPTNANTAVYMGADTTNQPSIHLVYEAGGLSSYGTMGQGGNAAEILESAFDGVNDSGEEPRTMRGGGTNSQATDLQSSTRFEDGRPFTFRVVSLDSVVTPSTFDLDQDGVIYYRELKDGTDPRDPTSFNPLSKGLVAYYPFNGNADDESGNSLDTAVYNPANTTLTEDRFGDASRAFQLGQNENGVDPVLWGTGIDLAGKSATISFWTYGQFSQAIDDYVGVDVGTLPPGSYNSGGAAGKNLAIYASWERIRFSFFYNDLDAPSSALVPNQWNHLAFTYDEQSRVRRILVNGQIVASDVAQYGFSGSPVFSMNGRNASNTSKIDDVRFYAREFSPTEVGQLYYAEAFTPEEKGFLNAVPSVLGHFSSAEYNANRTNGQTDVTANPAAFSLFTRQQFDSNRTAGQSDVISNPVSYGLYTSNSIMDLRMGGLMIQKQGTDATIVFQPQTTTDLVTLPFTNNGTPVTNTVPMPGDKGFLRVGAIYVPANNLSENQVIVLSDWAGLSAEEFFGQVTFPLVTALQELAGVRYVGIRDDSGFSMLTVFFRDGVDAYSTRTRVLEKLSALPFRLPEGVTVRVVD